MRGLPRSAKHDFVAPLESVLATQAPAMVWEKHIGPNLDACMGLIFEGIAEEACYRLQGHLDLPLVHRPAWRDARTCLPCADGDG